MIRSLMDLALSERVVVVVAAVVLAIAGFYSFRELDIEAYPDPVQPRVEIITQPLGLSAEEVEKIATIPLEVGLAGLRNLEAIRTISLFGLSDVKLYFTWDSDYYWDRVETINRLGLVTLPQNITPSISPDNPIGEIYRYIVQSPDHDLMEEKDVEDWILEKQLKTVPGVEDVSGFRRIDQAIPRGRGRCETQSLPVIAGNTHQCDRERQHQCWWELSGGRATGV